MEIYKINNASELKSNKQLIMKVFSAKTKIKLIKHGNGTIIFITNKNKIFVFGNNSLGQLGTGDYLNRNKFEEIKNHNLGIIKCLECNSSFGSDFTIIVNDMDKLFFTGRKYGLVNSNSFVLIDDKFNLKNINFVRSNQISLFIVNDDNNVQCAALYKPLSFKTIFNGNVKDLQCGHSHTILLDNNGNIYGYGDNSGGQLGLGDLQKTENNFMKIPLNYQVVKISCFQLGTLILNKYNELFGTGRNVYGELGLINLENINIFTKIEVKFNIKDIYSTFKSCNILTTRNNDIYVVGNNTNGNIGIKPRFCKKIEYKFSTIHYLNEFTKLEYFTTSKDNIIILPLLDNIYIVTSDYKIGGDEEKSSLATKCFKQLINEQNTDISIMITSTIHYSGIKKRKVN